MDNSYNYIDKYESRISSPKQKVFFIFFLKKNFNVFFLHLCLLDNNEKTRDMNKMIFEMYA